MFVKVKSISTANQLLHYYREKMILFTFFFLPKYLSYDILIPRVYYLLCLLRIIKVIGNELISCNFKQDCF